ncbi:MAG: PrgI family protein [Clostridiaceae bacterium]|nr:PrgI family protein [Clostridiaceae bacterium]
MEVKIPKEINRYTENVVGTMNLRQLIFGILTVVFAFFMFIKLDYSYTVKIFIIVPIVAPIAMLGFFEYNGMKAEELMSIIFRYIFSSNKLTCRPRTLYEFFYIEGNENGKNKKENERDNEELSQNSKKRSKYTSS